MALTIRSRSRAIRADPRRRSAPAATRACSRSRLSQISTRQHVLAERLGAHRLSSAREDPTSLRFAGPPAAASFTSASSSRVCSRRSSLRACSVRSRLVSASSVACDRAASRSLSWPCSVRRISEPSSKLPALPLQPLDLDGQRPPVESAEALEHSQLAADSYCVPAAALRFLVAVAISRSTIAACARLQGRAILLRRRAIFASLDQPST